MKLDLEVICLDKITTLKIERLGVFNDNVVKRLDAIQFIPNVAHLCVRLKEATCLEPEKSGLIIVSLHARYDGFSQLSFSRFCCSLNPTVVKKQPIGNLLNLIYYRRNRSVNFFTTGWKWRTLTQ